jgi:hypothetical protein
VSAAPGAASDTPLAQNARAAMWYARRGLRVHPLRPASKLPRLNAWQDRATVDLATVRKYWSQRPAAGVGIATGAESGVIVLDIDSRHHGDDTLAGLERDHGDLPATWRCLTAGGGLHLYWRYPGRRVGNRAAVWPGIDVRGDGGYVVAPPTVLDGGRHYAWEAGHGPHELDLADMPSWLLDRLSDHCNGGEGRPPDAWADLVRDGADHGTRNDAVARLAGHLLRRRPAPRVVLELLRAWNATRCRPPLDEEELVRTVDSIARCEAARRGNG